jgi:hypothetical protein
MTRNTFEYEQASQILKSLSIIKQSFLNRLARVRKPYRLSVFTQANWHGSAVSAETFDRLLPAKAAGHDPTQPASSPPLRS